MTPADAPTDAGLIGLDWGTSSLRGYRIGADGQVRETRARPWGIRHLPAGGYAAALADITAGWPAWPLLACGMVGSRGGWQETAYAEVPAKATHLAAALGRLRLADGRQLHIVPGLHQHRGPDVMRGEETQLIGAMAMHPHVTWRGTWILPGTHSKWVRVREQAIVDFHTLMTGELFDLLQRHSILAQTTQDAAQNAAQDTVADEAAFTRGVTDARDSGAAGMLSRLFCARSRVLDGELAAGSVPDYLSGLLIGEEFRSVLAAERFDTTSTMQLIGAPALCARYRRAGALFGLTLAQPVPEAAARGLWHIAGQAGLVTTRVPPPIPPMETSRC